MCPGVGTTPIVVPARRQPFPRVRAAVRAGPATSALAAATWTPKCAPHGSAASAWSTWWWVTSTVDALRVLARRGRPPRRRGGPGSSGPGSTRTARPPPGFTDHVGVGAVQASCCPRIGREHPGDERLERKRARHPARAPGGPRRRAGSTGAVTSGTVAGNRVLRCAPGSSLGRHAPSPLRPEPRRIVRGRGLSCCSRRAADPGRTTDGLLDEEGEFQRLPNERRRPRGRISARKAAAVESQPVPR